jgi:hypothetical protein
MEQQWRIRVRGTMRTEVDVNLLVQAVIALGEQLHAEQRHHVRAMHQDSAASTCPPDKEESS